MVNKAFVSPPPSPPSPPPSPPPNVLLQLNLESYETGSINSQAWPEGEMTVVVQSTSAARNGRYGLFIKVEKAFDQDWHAQVSLKPFRPPDTSHGYVFSFWARAAATQGKTTSPKLVFQDADDNYTPLKQVTLPLVADWHMYQVDFSLPTYAARNSGAIPAQFWRNSPQLSEHPIRFSSGTASTTPSSSRSGSARARARTRSTTSRSTSSTSSCRRRRRRRSPPPPRRRRPASSRSSASRGPTTA